MAARRKLVHKSPKESPKGGNVATLVAGNPLPCEMKQSCEIQQPSQKARVSIYICNTHAEWFIPFEHLQSRGAEQLLKLYDQVRTQSTELYRTVKGRQGAGKVLVDLIDWRKPFGINNLELSWISPTYRSGPVELTHSVEITLWYADKYGSGDPDYLSFGTSEQRGLKISGDVMVITDQMAQGLVGLISRAPEHLRIPRPKNHKLYVKNAIITPKPLEPTEPTRGTLSEGRYLTSFSDVVVPEIDVFELYDRINQWYVKLRGPSAKPVHFEALEPLTGTQINLNLLSMGYSNQPLRNAVLSALDYAGYLHQGPEKTYRPTYEGTSAWNFGKRHGFVIHTNKDEPYVRIKKRTSPLQFLEPAQTPAQTQPS